MTDYVSYLKMEDPFHPYLPHKCLPCPLSPSSFFCPALSFWFLWATLFDVSATFKPFPI